MASSRIEPFRVLAAGQGEGLSGGSARRVELWIFMEKREALSNRCALLAVQIDILNTANKVIVVFALPHDSSGEMQWLLSLKFCDVLVGKIKSDFSIFLVIHGMSDLQAHACH